MTRHTEKGQRFEFLVERMDTSRDEGYYIESMAIAYALLEERTYSLLDKLNIRYDSRHEKLYQCLKKVETNVVQQNISIENANEIIDFLQQDLIDSDLLDNIQTWREKRNDVIHDLAKETIAYESLEPYSIEGCELFRKYSAMIMRLKKKI